MSEIIKVLPPEPRRALIALSMFRFLTPKQFVRLGIGASDTVVRDYVLRRLEGRYRPLSKSKKIGQFLPKVHYLTKHGAEELAEMYRLPVEEFPYPIGAVQFGEMFARHRFAQVDFHIGLRMWANTRDDTEVAFVDMDFDVSGSRRYGTMEKKSEIPLPNSNKPVIADGIFGLMVNDRPLIYVLEVHRTTQTKSVAIQIQRYMDVLESGAVGFKYNMQTSPLILSVHTKENVLKGVKQHLMNTPDFEAFKPAFLFNTTEQINKDFSKGWTFADDTHAHPFPSAEKPNKQPLIE